ncbi:MAG: hypothetical protein ACRBN8_46380 [Nannocystales bacterium]
MTNTKKRIHPLCEKYPDVSSPEAHIASFEAAARDAESFEDEDVREKLWLGVQAGGTIRKVGSKYAIVVDVPEKALRHIARYEHGERIGYWDGHMSQRIWNELFPNNELGQEPIPDLPPMPSVDALAAELASDRGLFGYTTDDDGLIVHAPFGGEPAGAQTRFALRTRTWPGSIAAAAAAVSQLQGYAAQRNELVLALCGDDTRAAWCSSMRERVEVVDAVALGELHPTSDEELTRWAFADASRWRLARASFLRLQPAAE